MKTTNLITDFIIIGTLGFLCLILPYIMIDFNIVVLLFKSDFKNSGLILAIATLVVYLFGIFYNQLSDYCLEKFKKILFIKSINEHKTILMNKLGYDYHYALQKIVIYSKNSFEYLSYRRTMLRIIRSFIFSSVLFIFLHLLYSALVVLMTDIELKFSLLNLLIILIVIICGVFFRYIYIKLYKGYFDAIINFSQLIDKSDAITIQD